MKGAVQTVQGDVSSKKLGTLEASVQKAVIVSGLVESIAEPGCEIELFADGKYFLCYPRKGMNTAKIVEMAMEALDDGKELTFKGDMASGVYTARSLLVIDEIRYKGKKYPE